MPDPATPPLAATLAADPAPALPPGVRLLAWGHACDAADPATVPGDYPVAADFADLGLDPDLAGDAGPAGGGPLPLRTTASAVFRRAGSANALVPVADGADPDNLDALEGLAAALGRAEVLRRLARFDVEFWGAVAVPPDGTVDAVEFRHDGAGGARTRLRSLPAEADPPDFNHADPGDCPECVEAYGPPPGGATPAGSTARLPKYRWCLDGRGRSTLELIGYDAFNGCCNCPTTVSATILPTPGAEVSPQSCWYPPGLALLTVAGTADDGRAIALGPIQQSVIPQVGPGSAKGIVSWSFTGAQLPAGTYTFRVYAPPQACDSGAESQFDGSVQATVRCPSTAVALTLTNKFDIVDHLTHFFLSGCDRCASPTLQVASSGAEQCTAPLVGPDATAGGSAGNVSVRYKIRSYPCVITDVGSGDNCFSHTTTTTYSGPRCSVYRTDPTRSVSGQNGGRALVIYKKYAVWVSGLFSGAAGRYLGGATVTLSGAYSGTGTTVYSGADDPPCLDTIDLDAVDLTQQDFQGRPIINAAVSAPGYCPSSGRYNGNPCPILVSLCPVTVCNCGGGTSYGPASASGDAAAATMGPAPAMALTPMDDPGPAPAAVAAAGPAPRPAGLDRELVVARYTEDARWAEELA